MKKEMDEARDQIDKITQEEIAKVPEYEFSEKVANILKDVPTFAGQAESFAGTDPALLRAKLYDLVKNNKKLLPKSKLLGDDIYFRIKNFLNFPKKLIYNDLKFQINCILQSKYTISPKKSLIA